MAKDLGDFQEFLFGWESKKTVKKRRKAKKRRRAREAEKRKKQGRRKTLKEFWKDLKEDISDFIHGK